MRRSREKLEEAIKRAKASKTKAFAYFKLALFHDNNSREAQAIPNYEKALKLGLANKTRAEALAWLASSLFKAGQFKKALQKIRVSRQIAKDKKLTTFLDGLERRINKKLL